MAPRTAVAPYELAAEGGERLRFGEVEVVVKASADTTGGAFTLFEENEPVDTPRWRLFAAVNSPRPRFLVGQSRRRSPPRRSRVGCRCVSCVGGVGVRAG
jgi:hypothetical protein